MIIEKANGNILEIGYYDAKNVEILIKLIVNNCPKIEKLGILLDKDFIHLEPLLLNCRKLKFLEIYSEKLLFNVRRYLLDILTKFSPNSLTEILFYDGSPSYLQIFKVDGKFKAIYRRKA